MMDEAQLKRILEGLLLTAGKPLSLDKLAELIGEKECPDREKIKEALTAIAESCEGHGYELKKVASGYRYQVRQELSEWIGRLWEEKPQRYSRALLETLAIIAYRQPITRGDIEKIRGVAVSSSIMRTLLERDWVRVVGHRDVPGRPAMYASTRQFLDYFNLESLNDLPALTEIRDMEGLNQDMIEDEAKPEGKVLEFPSDLYDDEIVVPDEEELAAAAIGTRSMDEILGIEPSEIEDEEDDEDFQDSLLSDTNDGGVYEDDEDELMQDEEEEEEEDRNDNSGYQ